MNLPKTPLSDILDTLHKQSVVLGRARDKYLEMESERHHYEAQVILKAPGSSMAERKVQAEATEEWLLFHRALARLESVYEFQKFKAKILELEYQAQYLQLKMDGSLIKKEQ